MSMVLSHKSALRCLMDSGCIPANQRAYPWNGYTAMILDAVPTYSDLQRARNFLSLGDEESVHTMVFDHGMYRVLKHVVVHSCSLSLPEGSIRQFDRNLYAVCPELCLMQLARTEQLGALVACAYMLCSSFSFERDSGTLPVRDPLTSVGKICSYAQAFTRHPGANNLVRACRYVRDGAASPKEIELVMMLCLPCRLGGYGLPFPELNGAIVIAERHRDIASASAYRCDLFWRQANLSVEYESHSHHATRSELASDSSRRNALAAMGKQVITVTTDQLNDLRELDKVAKIVGRKLGVRVRVDEGNWRERQVKLRAQIRGVFRAMDSGGFRW